MGLVGKSRLGRPEFQVLQRFFAHADVDAAWLRSFAHNASTRRVFHIDISGASARPLLFTFGQQKLRTIHGGSHFMLIFSRNEEGLATLTFRFGQPTKGETGFPQERAKRPKPHHLIIEVEGSPSTR